jgi:fructose/tagatose bisphosphate aldolase
MPKWYGLQGLIIISTHQGESMTRPVHIQQAAALLSHAVYQSSQKQYDYAVVTMLDHCMPAATVNKFEQHAYTSLASSSSVADYAYAAAVSKLKRFPLNRCWATNMQSRCEAGRTHCLPLLPNCKVASYCCLLQQPVPKGY